MNLQLSMFATYLQQTNKASEDLCVWLPPLPTPVGLTMEVRAISSVIFALRGRWCMFLSCALKLQMGPSVFALLPMQLATRVTSKFTMIRESLSLPTTSDLWGIRLKGCWCGEPLIIQPGSYIRWPGSPKPGGHFDTLNRTHLTLFGHPDWGLLRAFSLSCKANANAWRKVGAWPALFLRKAAIFFRD